MRRRWFRCAPIAAVLLASCGTGEPNGNRASARPTRETSEPMPVAAAEVEGATPMRDRVAVLGVLNKRNGEAIDLEMKPGEAFRTGNAVVRLRACDRTQNWEPEQLTGAFVQVDVADRTGQAKRIFSGWLFKETPSLNVVEHPIYDVWVKECRMNRPGEDAPTEEAPAEAASNAAQSASTDNASASNTE